jgi:microcystin-dependent protein
MALESATYLSQLNPAFPASTDLLAQGDDHLRLIKAVLQATFPNINGPVSVTDEDINSVVSLIASGSGGLVPTGAITAWYGASGAVPTGWHICDGTTGIARSDGAGTISVPDLRNLVIMGAGTVAAQGATFGAENHTATTAPGGAHAHATVAGGGGHIHSGVTVAGHALTVGEMPSHDHTIGGNPGTGGGSLMQTSGGSASTIHVSSTGGGAAHSHDMSWPTTPDGTHTHATDTADAHTHGVTVPSYQPALALHYIMKV